jgi:hypothetical protein|tara:strand:- start:1239 stop:1712 length:474 start_codon:yes stop_codon:yes gene_type:complete
MAETLGSLVDKLSIKNLRYWHLDESIQRAGVSGPQVEELKAKLDLVNRQRQDLLNEVNDFLIAALAGDVNVRDEKVKLYKNLNVSSFDSITKLGAAVSELVIRNTRMWHLEDEVRREDLPDVEIVQLKRKIDRTNQERCDLVDKVDEILGKAMDQKK